LRFGADFVFCNKNWSVEAHSARRPANGCEDYGNLADRRWMRIAEGRNRYRQMIDEAVAASIARRVA
jgi:hypothetical protein